MASNEDRVGKFLERLLQNRSPEQIVQSLARDERPLAPRIPGGSSISVADIESRWQLLHVPEQSKAAVFNPQSGESFELYRQNIENCIGTVKIPVGLARSGSAACSRAGSHLASHRGSRLVRRARAVVAHGASLRGIERRSRRDLPVCRGVRGAADSRRQASGHSVY